MMTTNRPKETREQRARREYHSYRLTPAELKVRPHAAPSVGIREEAEYAAAVVYVAHRTSIYTVPLCSDQRGDLHPCGCCCEDWLRRKRLEHYPAPCKHQIAVGLWLAGDPPPIGGDNGFDIEAEAARLARLEAAERESRELWEDHR